jgi:predicted DNA binding protein
VTIWEISLRAQYDYPFMELSREFPETEITMWCVWNREMIRVPTHDPSILPGFERALRKAGRVVDHWSDGDDARVFLLRCTCSKYDSPWTIIGESDCFDAPPLVYRGGWGYCRVLSPDAAHTRTLFAEFHRRGSAELIRKRELPLSALPTTVWTHGLFGELTEKQIGAILAAFRHGYYASPRRVTTDDVARELDVSRSTYEEHLRKAENRLIAALIPYLELYATSRKPVDHLPLRTTLSEPIEAR